MAQVFAAGVLLFLILFFIGAYVPKKIKKIYLNNVDEMQNREYIDLSQVWHDASEEPQGEYEIICQDEFRHVWLTDYREDINHYKNGWKECAECECIVRWAYIDDLLPKGGK